MFKERDRRVRHQLETMAYFRRVRIERVGFKLQHTAAGVTRECCDVEATWQGMRVANWVCRRVVTTIAANPIVGGSYAGTFTFKQQTDFATAEGERFTATHLFASFRLSGGWFEHPATIDGTAGSFDFIRRRIRVGSGAAEFSLKGLDLTKGDPVEHPPASELDRTNWQPGEGRIELLYLLDANCDEPVPPLDGVIIEKDLDPAVAGLSPQLQPRSGGAPAGRTAQTSVFVSRNPRVGPDHSFTVTTRDPSGTRGVSRRDPARPGE